jgi:phytoene dehydrogenase-like protein
MNLKFDTVVVGGGIAGLTAAAYISRAGRSVLLVEKQPKTGGLVQTFERNGVWFDTGLRSIENSGIVLPMLKQLGIDIDFVPSPVTIGIGKDVLRVKGPESVDAYEEFLKSHYPDNKEDVAKIVLEIKKIMRYMDVLYGIDNPLFINMMADKKYLLKVILPWSLRFLLTVRKTYRLQEPADEYLTRFTKSQPLIDMIAQHFFQKTPTSFALSYFRLYLDYHYAVGGTAVLAAKLDAFIRSQGGEILTSTTVESLNPEGKYVIDSLGRRIEYGSLVWAADMKLLYNSINIDELTGKAMVSAIQEKKALLKDLRGGDSVYTVYLSVKEKKEYFSAICSGHFFWTPVKTGLSKVNTEGIEDFLATHTDPGDTAMKERIKAYLTEFCDFNTFEISIPVLRDPGMAPEGTTGLIVSLLFDYRLSKKLDELGWSAEIRDFLEKSFIRVLDEGIFPGLTGKITDCLSSTPVTLERLTGNSHGAITGWAFTNPVMPVVTKMLKSMGSVVTPLPSVYQAGQWVFSPAGLPISILTGKLASDKVLGGR